jgi:hypothetical protein
MRLTACDCRAVHYRRVRRPQWMRRMVPSRRLYHCLGCEATLLILPRHAVGSPFRDTSIEWPEDLSAVIAVPRYTAGLGTALVLVLVLVLL